MNALVRFSLDHRPLVLMGWLVLALLGGWCALRLPVDAVPDVTNTQVQVLTSSPGLPPQDVERLITEPVELAMGSLPRLHELRSVSRFGLSVVTVVFEEGSDIYRARQLVGERLGEAREAIPETYGQPEMGPISSGLGEIYQFEVHGEKFSPMELRTILDWQIIPRLRSVAGVVEVNAFGGHLKTWQVTVDPDKLMALDLSLSDVFEALERNNRNVGGGYLERGSEQYLIRGEGMLSSLDDLANTVVKHDAHGETPVFVRDIADVGFAPMLRQGAVTRDGEGEAVTGIVMMLLGENSRVVARAVDERIEEIRPTLPEGVTIDTFYDRTELVDATLHTVAKNLLEGGALVVLVLLLLLGNVRAALLVASSIPLSMLVAAIGMKVFNISGNLMSLGALDFGLIVDGSVVMIENAVRSVHHHRSEGHPLNRIREACLEMARPVAFAVGIIALVYVPILALSGVEGKMFRPMALTVVFALAGSLLCALTLMPVLASWFLKNAREKEPRLYLFCRKLYQPLLNHLIRRPVLVAGVAMAVFAGSMVLVPRLGAEFMPKLDEGAVAMQIWRLPSVSLEQSNQISSRAERILKEQFPEVKTVVSRTGRAEIATDPMGVEVSDVYIMLNPRNSWRFQRKEELVEAMSRALSEDVPGARFSFSQPIELRMSELLAGVRGDVAVKIFGDDLDQLAEVAEQAASLLQDIEGAGDVKAERLAGLPTLRMRLQRDALARHGMRAEDVLEVVESIGGKQVGTVYEGNRRFALRVRVGESWRNDPERLSRLPVAASMVDGTRRLVPLGQVATIEIEEGPAQISRESGSRRAGVEVMVRGRDLASFVREAQLKLADQLELPDGWYLVWSGRYENLQNASQRLALLVPMVMLLILAMLYGAFDSMRLSTMVFLNVPLAISGGVVALWLRGYPFSISAGVGFIALCGIATLNGVVLCSRFKQLGAEGETNLEAARDAALLRLRPVLMTALVAALGFVPMALSTGAGAEVQRPLATVVIGGLVSATALTLLVLPALLARLKPA